MRVHLTRPSNLLVSVMRGSLGSDKYFTLEKTLEEGVVKHRHIQTQPKDEGATQRGYGSGD